MSSVESRDNPKCRSRLGKRSIKDVEKGSSRREGNTRRVWSLRMKRETFLVGGWSSAWNAVVRQSERRTEMMPMNLAKQDGSSVGIN